MSPPEARHHAVGDRFRHELTRALEGFGFQVRSVFENTAEAFIQDRG